MTWERLIEKMHKIRNDWSVIDWLYHVFYFVKDKITALEDRCTALEARCTELEKKVVEIFEEITGLKEKDEEQDEAIANIQNVSTFGIMYDAVFTSISYSESRYLTSSFDAVIYHYFKNFFGIMLPNITSIEINFDDNYVTYSMDTNSSDFLKLCSVLNIHRVESNQSDYVTIAIGFSIADLYNALSIMESDDITRMTIHVSANEVGILDV